MRLLPTDSFAVRQFTTAGVSSPVWGIGLAAKAVFRWCHPDESTTGDAACCWNVDPTIARRCWVTHGRRLRARMAEAEWQVKNMA